ncbi:Lon protease family protein [Mariniblastus fucicola]|uniref:Lon protease family protein n=1 Tax=Mariniblastus fucicola TaxID=980251 RepID=UPI00143D0CDE|nr:AAA family ATPase [Mariniblastus fucicola]
MKLKTLVPVEDLRWSCCSGDVGFETTAELVGSRDVEGQQTAREAIEFGITCLAPGQNIYVRGARGTGRIRMVRHLLSELAPTSESKRDFCYVHNFSRPEHPRLIELPPGDGPKFRKQMIELAEFAESDLVKSLEGEPWSSQRHEIQESVQQEIKAKMKPLEDALQGDGLALVQGQGPGQAGIFPVIEGQPVPTDRLGALVAQGQLTSEAVEKIETAINGYQKQLKDIGREINEHIREASLQIKSINETAANELIEPWVTRISNTWDLKSVREFLADVVKDIIEFRIDSEEDPPLKILYGVNVVLTQADAKSRPVVEESMPNLMNLLGTVEPDFGPNGVAVSDYRGVHAGAILRADEGYLILDVYDLLSEPGAWRALMRTLRTGMLEIVPPEASWMRQTVVTQPEPIQIRVRVILIGDARTWYQLDHVDPDFRELFKVLADFDSEILRDSLGIAAYGQVIANLCEEESLPHFHKSAVAELAEHGARIVARPDRLTAKFGRIADIAREAAFLADGELVQQSDIVEAVRRTKRRASLPSRKFQEMVNNRTIMVETSGAIVGQINGLAVMHSGPLTYGFPARITATIGPGTAGLINIEGRAQMSGTIHTKGFHILGGLLRHLIRTKHPLAFSASLAFEQSYGGIDGDSASGAEMVCLLSALTDIPVKQSMAMTGAIDQHGNIEAIGGVNEKIEGFFDACNFSTLTGDQGVVIPKSNAGDLMLRDDVVEACSKGAFHVYAVETIHEALALMTGHEIGALDEEGNYPDDSMLGMAVEKAHQFWRRTLSSPAQFTQTEKAEPDPEDMPPTPPPISIRD